MTSYTLPDRPQYILFQHFLFEYFKLLSSEKSVSGGRRRAKDAEKVCGRGKKTDVFSGKGGGGGGGHYGEREPRVPSCPLPLSHLPPCGIFLHE